MNAYFAWNCVLGKFRAKFPTTLPTVIIFHIRFLQKSTMLAGIFNHIATRYNKQHLTPSWTPLLCSVNNLTAARALR
jgi:hypothetical protein